VRKITTELKRLTDPVGHTLTPQTIRMIYICWIVIVGLAWYLKDSTIIPKPHAIFVAATELFKSGFALDLMASLVFTFKSMSAAMAIAFAVAFAGLIPVVRPIVLLIGKSRFLSTAGFTVIFAIMTSDAQHQKFSLMVFCVLVFQVVSFIDIMFANQERLDYCFTLKMKPWRIVWEEMILAKRSDMMVTVRQNFAIAWMSLPMIEGISRVDGGIGIVLEDLRRHLRYDHIFAVQFIILLCGIGIDFTIEKLRKSLYLRWA
jgi:ABC-type nitrate/sulfonate/bicarbonate transport system permease component